MDNTRDAQDARATEDTKITRRQERPRLAQIAPIPVNSAKKDGIAQIRVSHTKIKQVAFAEYPLMGGNCWACDSDLTPLKKHQGYSRQGKVRESHRSQVRESRRVERASRAGIKRAGKDHPRRGARKH
ncbi:unnamed protein product [Linum trigynum]|uniref:Uncharacterized protein n=1 Tax=Linum trigynum TaxID=586398 RepID=A0AAV2EDH0_9ROSI